MPVLEGEGMAALSTAGSQNLAAALRAAAHEEAVSTGTLDLGGLISTLGSHDESLKFEALTEFLSSAPTAGRADLNRYSIPGFPRWN